MLRYFFSLLLLLIVISLKAQVYNSFNYGRLGYIQQEVGLALGYLKKNKWFHYYGNITLEYAYLENGYEKINPLFHYAGCCPSLTYDKNSKIFTSPEIGLQLPFGKNRFFGRIGIKQKIKIYDRVDADRPDNSTFPLILIPAIDEENWVFTFKSTYISLGMGINIFKKKLFIEPLYNIPLGTNFSDNKEYMLRLSYFY